MSVDRGDDFIPTGPDASVEDDAARIAAEAASKAAADAAAKAASDAEAKKAAEDKAAADAAALDAKNKAEDKGDEQSTTEGKEKSKVVPRERLDAAQRKAKDRADRDAARIAELERANYEGRVSVDVQKLQATLTAAKDKYEELIFDGKKDEARKVRNDIDRMTDALSDYRTTTQADKARSLAVEQVNFQATLSAAEAKYNELNPDHPDFDEAKTDEVSEMMDAFVSRGNTRDQALTKALKYVMQPDKNDQSSALRDKRAEEAREKAAVAAGKQPADLAKVGLNSDAAGKKPDDKGPNILKMNQDQFAKLDEETKAKLRGDEV